MRGMQAECKSTDYSRPALEEEAGVQEAQRLSERIASYKRPANPMRVAVIGGGLAGLSTAKYLADAGHTPIVYEAESTLGGKVLST